jgi:hypothetical protein
MATMNERLSALQNSIESKKHDMLLLEKVATDLLEEARHAGDTETYIAAVRCQHAFYIAYNVLNINPDKIDQALEKHGGVGGIRTGWIRWLTSASDAAILAFHENQLSLIGDEDDNLPSDITASA